MTAIRLPTPCALCGRPVQTAGDAKGYHFGGRGHFVVHVGCAPHVEEGARALAGGVAGLLRAVGDKVLQRAFPAGLSPLARDVLAGVGTRLSEELAHHVQGRSKPSAGGHRRPTPPA